MTSKWTQSAPAARTLSTSSPRRAKFAERIDGAMTMGCLAMDVSSWISSGSSRLYRPMPCAQIGAPEMRQALAPGNGDSGAQASRATHRPRHWNVRIRSARHLMLGAFFHELANSPLLAYSFVRRVDLA